MKATQSLCRYTRHYQMTGKTGPRGFYKGTGSGSMGSHTKHGGYIVDYDKVRTYVAPAGLNTCKLTPFVTNKVRPMRQKFNGPDDLPISGVAYLKRWKEENGED